MSSVHGGSRRAHPKFQALARVRIWNDETDFGRPRDWQRPLCNVEAARQDSGG